MSEENVERVQRAWQAFNLGDLDGFLEGAAPDCEFHEDSAFPDAGTYRGLEEIRAYIVQFQEHMAEQRFEVEEIRDLGDRVLAFMHEQASGATSGVDVELRPVFLYTFRGPAVIRVDAFLDREQALEAAGLSE
jgi:ketosteroid isomerase-like protein